MKTIQQFSFMALVFFTAFVMFGASNLLAQRGNPVFEAEVDSMKLEYVKMGIPAESAEARARAIVESQQVKSGLSRAGNLSNNPNTGSIHVNRDATIRAYTPTKLVEEIFVKGGACSSVSNVKLSSHGWDEATQKWRDDNDRGLGYFTRGTSNFEFAEGLVLSTGSLVEIEGPNSASNGITETKDKEGKVIGDPDLQALLANVRNVSVLEFDFVPVNNIIQFRYVFASEEYANFVDNVFNDVFGFFISGPGITGKQNIATLPVSGNPIVSINSVNDGKRDYSKHNCPVPGAGKNSQYYINIPGEWTQDQYCNPTLTPDQKALRQSMEFNGRTVALTATCEVTPCQTYHLKLAVGNVYDENFQSGVFLEAQSFDLGDNFETWGNMIKGNDAVYTGCSESKFVLTRPKADATSLTMNISYGGSAASSATQPNGDPLPASVTIPANQKSVEVFYVVNNLPAGQGTLEITIPCCGGEGNFTSHVITIYNQSPALQWTGEVSTDWNDAGNWTSWTSPNGKSGIPGLNFAPQACTDVLIPKGLSRYPDLTPVTGTDYTRPYYSTASCSDIWLEHGGEIVRTDLLNYDGANVQLALTTDRWYMLSAPLRYMFPGDYYRDNPCPFADKMRVYTQLFAMENPQANRPDFTPTGDWSGPFNNPEIAMPTGFGFAAWIDDGSYSGQGQRENGKQMMWFPKNDISYNIYTKGTCDVVSVRPLDRNQSVINNNWHHRFVYEPVWNKSTGEITLTTPQPAPGTKQLIVGNPFMAHWDFSQFRAQNSDKINNAYYILEGPDDAAFTTYATPIGSNLLIAPMQSIVVTALRDLNTNDLKTNVNSTKQNSGNTLRSAEAGTKPGLLKIVAGRNGQQNHTYVLFDEKASNSYLPDEDSYKLFVGSVTEPVTVYTRSSDNFALDINIFGDCKQMIPLGIRTSKTGNIDLHFEGIENFLPKENVYLVDTQNNAKIDLKKTPAYSFNKTTEDLFMDNRLFLSINKMTGNIQISTQGATSISTERNSLQIISSDKIKQVEVIDMQGRMIHKETNIENHAYTCELKYNGIYIVRLLTEQETVVKKVIIGNK